MQRKKALLTYLSGTLGQIIITCLIVYLLRYHGIQTDYTTVIGMLAIGIGGISSALWGVIISMKYRKISFKKILMNFINIKQSYRSYALVLLFLLLDFGNILFGGQIQIRSWYIPIILFLKAMIFGGIEEIGWRYTFQPILQEKCHYVLATVVTFLAWGAWHFLYFYIEGSLCQVDIIPFLMGLLTNCFILSALYSKTKSLWICAMTHALINVLSQLASGGNVYLLLACRVMIIILAVYISVHANKKVCRDSIHAD